MGASTQGIRKTIGMNTQVPPVQATQVSLFTSAEYSLNVSYKIHCNAGNAKMQNEINPIQLQDKKICYNTIKYIKPSIL